jgi:hypothetical protein
MSEATRDDAAPPSPLRSRTGVRGRGTRRRPPESACLNCGDGTYGEYCPACGQRKTEILVSVRTMVAEVLEDEFILNRRLPRTLFNLFFRPGFLTLEHVNGRVVRYIPPFKLYLVSSVVFFLLLSFFSLRMLTRAEFGVPGTVSETAAGDTLNLAEIDSALARLQRIERDPATHPAARLGIAQTRDAVERERTRALAREGVVVVVDTAAPSALQGRQTSRTLGEMLELDGEQGSVFSGTTGYETLDSALVRRSRALADMTPREALERLVGDFVNYVPTLMFVLLPIFALVLKLLYLRRRRYYAEHFVFLLHTHAFAFLLFTAMILARAVYTLPGWLFMTLMGWASVYIFLALKRVYGQGWGKTLVKGWVLGWAYFALFVFSVPVALIVSFLFL